MQQPTFAMARTKEGVRVALPDYVENAFELLDEAGEWYLDRPAKTIYYKPRPGEDRTKVQVIVPALETLIEVRGSVEHPVRNVTFQNLTFADATWLQPSRIGHADVQANFLNDPARPLKRDGVVTTIHNEQLKSPGNAVYRVPTPMNYNNRAQNRIKNLQGTRQLFPCPAASAASRRAGRHLALTHPPRRQPISAARLGEFIGWLGPRATRHEQRRVQGAEVRTAGPLQPVAPFYQPRQWRW